jgi:guanylate kinase
MINYRSRDNQASEMTGGILYVISAPSGAGKTTLLKRIMGEFPEIRFSVSYTTRPPRPGEKEGVDYHFVSQDGFQKMLSKGAFAEWTEVHGNCYGTSKAFLEECLTQDLDVILDIDTRGAEQIHKGFPSRVTIFIMPPGMSDLRDRLTQRGSETQEMIDLRLRNASKEIEKIDKYDYVVVNERLDDAVEKIKSIIIAERCKRRRILHSLRRRRGS